jgi:hypothetical protein
MMAEHLREFLAQRMQINVPAGRGPREELVHGVDQAIVLLDAAGGDHSVAESGKNSLRTTRYSLRTRRFEEH